jgi:hypothetical protein
LRPRVLGVVASQLRKDPPSRCFRWSAIATVGLLVLGLCLNVWVAQTTARHMARFAGPPPAPREISELQRDLERVADPQVVRQLCQRFAPPHGAGDTAGAYHVLMQQLIDELQPAPYKEPRHETT